MLIHMYHGTYSRPQMFYLLQEAPLPSASKAVNALRGGDDNTLMN